VIEEIGTVRSTDGPLAIVDVPKKSACEGCTAGTCKIEDQFMEIEAFNRAGAKVGDKVVVSVKAFTFTKGSMMVYGLPAIGLVVGAVFGKEAMAGIFTGIDPDTLSAIFGFGVFILTLVFVKIWSNSAGKKIESKPIIEEVLNER
jgi:sigma-E factor negative regulatory protein RseC